MAYRLEQNEHLGVGVRRIVSEQVEKAIAELDDGSLNSHETVHQVRKRCKKVRGLLRLVRPGLGKSYSKKNEAYRDAARLLSPIRDAAATLETYDELMEIYGDLVDLRRFRAVRTTFERQKDSIEADLAIDERLDEFRAFCDEQLQEIEHWEVDGGENGTQLIAGGLQKTYARGYDEFHAAIEDGTSEAYHEWRKRVKYHWYHMRVLRDVWPTVVRARRDEVDMLSDLLGDEHDLAVMSAQIEADPHSYAGCRTIQALTGLIQQRRLELQEKSRAMGARVYAESPDAFGSRFETYVDVWKSQPSPGE